MRRPEDKDKPAVADNLQLMLLFPKDTQDWVREHDYPQSRCANRRLHWDCYACGHPTPVGFSFCPDTFSTGCLHRVMAQRDHALNALEDLQADLYHYG